MVSGPEDEFANFLEFSDLQIEFSPYDHHAPNGGHVQSDAMGGMDETMENGVGLMGLKEAHMQQSMDRNMLRSQTSIPTLSTLSDVHTSTESLLDLNIQAQMYQQQRQQQHQHQQHQQHQEQQLLRQHQQQQQQHQQQLQMQGQYQRQRVIPPTPTSMELQANQAQYYPQVDPQQAVYEHFRKQKEQVGACFNPSAARRAPG